MRLFASSCSLNFLMYSQIFLVISVRGIGAAPITAASVADGVTGFMNAALGLRGADFFAATFLAGAFFAAGAFAATFFAATFLAAGFFTAAFFAGATFFAGAAFLAAGFFTAAFLAAGFLAAGFLAVAIFKPPSQDVWEIASYHAPVIVVCF